MKRVVLLLTLLVALAIQPIFAATADEEIRDVLNKQVDAWNKGDIDAFMSAYDNSPSLSYISGGAEVWGYSALRERYLERYGKTPETMGKLSTPDLKIVPLAERAALVIGHWHLQRKDQPDASGVYSLVVVKVPREGWKILNDHTSLSETKSDAKAETKH